MTTPAVYHESGSPSNKAVSWVQLPGAEDLHTYVGVGKQHEVLIYVLVTRDKETSSVLVTLTKQQASKIKAGLDDVLKEDK